MSRNEIAVQSSNKYPRHLVNGSDINKINDFTWIIYRDDYLETHINATL